MADIDYLDYRLRCHTKRTDLPVDVLRDIGEAYAEIMRLKRERDAARREVCREEAYRPSPSPPCTASQVADRRGWDCFKRTPMTDGATIDFSQTDLRKHYNNLYKGLCGLSNDLVANKITSLEASNKVEKLLGELNGLMASIGNITY